MGRRRFDHNPLHVSVTIGEEFHRLGEAPPLPFPVLRAWEEAVGQHIAKNVIPAWLQGTTLWVRATTSSWIAHMQMLLPSVLEQLGELLDSPRIDAVKFKLDPAPEQVLKPPEPEPPVPPPEPLIELPEAVERALDQVDDEPLREAIRSAVALSLAARRAPDRSG